MELLGQSTNRVSSAAVTSVLCAVVFCLLPAALCLLFCPQVQAQNGSGTIGALEEQAIKQAAALVAPSLVRIETVGGLDRVGQILIGTGPTTGVIVSPDGYVISSSFNFISKPASILVTLPDGRRLPAVQVANDKVKMLTLLKVAAEKLVPAAAAPVDGFRVGQWAIALGRTFDDGMNTPSVSVGIVSALKRIWGKAIQTDAKVSPVNYGGPLVDIQGRVLGILVPLSPQAGGEVAGVEWYDGGIGFAIPLADVYAALDRLKAGKDLLPGLMGVNLKGRDMYEGQPVIDRVRYNSPAQQAGLKEGDAIVEIDGGKVVRQTQILSVMANKYAGDKVAISVKRVDETISRELTLVDKLVPYESAFLGILPARPEAGKPADKGVRIRYLIPDSPADKAKLDRDQQILRFNDIDLTDAAKLLDLVSRVRPGEKVRLSVQSGKETRDVDVTLGSIPETAPDDDLRAFPIVPRDNTTPEEGTPKVGEFADKMPAHEHDFWAYVPEDYNPDFRYALVIWLHPAGDTMQAAMSKAWKPLCDERGIILLAPKAKQLNGWNADESEFVKDLVEQFLDQYSIDRRRVVLHGYANSGGFTYHLAFKHRQLFHGISTAAAPMLQPPPDNEPDFRLQFHLITSNGAPSRAGVTATAEGLRKMKYPVVLSADGEGGDQKYPSASQLKEIVHWIDALDRI